EQNQGVVLTMVLAFDIEILQRQRDRERSGDQENQPEEVGKLIDCERSSISGHGKARSFIEKPAGEGDADKSKNSQLLLVLDNKVRNQQHHTPDDQFEFWRDRCEVLNFEELLHYRRSPACASIFGAP